LPLPAVPIEQTANVPHRYALNDTDDGYTGPYRSWEDWQRLIDVLALHGVNEVLVTVGQEAVYYDTFQDFGYTEQEMREWITLPAHQPWWLLQNMCCFGGPISKQLIDQRVELGKKIADHLRELGMTPVFPGYYGTVPTKFVEKNPTGRVIPQGGWVGFTRPDWLDPRNALFPQVAASFYRHQKDRFGDSTMYKMDLLHEGGNAGDVPVSTAAKAVETALQTAHPGAIWAILGWQSNPSAALLAPLDKSKVLLVDGLSDRYTGLNRESSWGNTPYAFGTIWNFGGHTTMGANLGEWNTRYWQWKNKVGSQLSGIAMMPEGGLNNPVAFDFFTEMAWQSGPVDLAAWFGDWAERRYGGKDANAAAAWQIIRQTAYNMPGNGWSEAQDGLFAAQPSLSVNTAATWSPSSMRYDASAFNAALPALLQVKPTLQASSAYRYDLMDVTRQVLSNQSRILLPKIKTAYDAKNAAAFTALTDQWLHYMKLMDEVVATNKQTMLGPWLEDATRAAADPAERAKLEFDARSILTVWGDRSGAVSGGLHDYANREWAGLVGDFYYTRWKLYFDSLKSALSNRTTPATMDWFANGDSWSRQQNVYATEPQGDIVQIAQKVLHELSSTGTVSYTASVDQAIVSPGQPVTITGVIKNDSSFSTVKNIREEVPTGDSFIIHSLTPLTIDELAPGATFTVKFQAMLLDNASSSSGLSRNIPLSSSYVAGSKVETATTYVNILASQGISSSYRTISFNNAKFAQVGNAFGIYGGGADLWGGTNEFGAIYADDGMQDLTTVTTQVSKQDATGPWARAGIIVRNDMTSNGSTGFLNFAVTPSNGCVLSWDANGDGKLESYTNKTGHTAPSYLRLTRSGTTFTGACSSDGSQWTTVGSATITQAAAKQDVGIFMTAAGSQNGIAEFAGFNLQSEGVNPSSIALDRTTALLNLDTNSSLKLHATVLPVNASNTLIHWTTSNPMVAAVDQQGVVTAKGIGTATITATTEQGGLTASAAITVVATGPAVTGVELTPSAITIPEGGYAELTARILPVNALNQNLTWSSSNTDVVGVQAAAAGKAMVTGKQVGTAVITVRSVDGDFTARSTVTVRSKPANLALNKPVSSDSASNPASYANDGNDSTRWIANSGAAGKWWKVDLGEMYSLSGSEIHFEKNVLWKYKVEVSSDNMNWISVADRMNHTSTDKIQSHAFNQDARYVRVTFDAAPGANWTEIDEFLVYGYPLSVSVTGVELNLSQVTIPVGETATLIATVLPTNAANQNVTWSTSNDQVAKIEVVHGRAIVTAMRSGTATITVKTEDGGFTTSSQVTVTSKDAAATLMVDSPVRTGQPFVMKVGLIQVASPIFAEDFVLEFDPSRFEYMSAESIRIGVNLVQTKLIEPGKLRLILASEGSQAGVIANAELIKITMKAKTTLNTVTERIAVSQATIADDMGNEKSASLTSVNVEIIAGIIGDLNGDGKVSIGDLAVAAAAYGMTSASPGWDQAKRADLNGDNKIDIADLALIAQQILK